MSFLSNHLTLRHEASGVVLQLEPRAALRACSHDKSHTAREPLRQEKATAATTLPGRPQQGSVHPGVAAAAAAAAASAAPVSKHPGAASSSAPAAGGPARLQVSAASKWTAKSYEGLVEGGVKQIDFNFDWTYTTLYKGDLLQPSEQGGALKSALQRAEKTNDEIKVEMLQRPDPILWYDSLPLFEDELHDNGVSTLSIKVRVMESCFLVLLQFWLRVDDILVRVYDTRVFHEFGTGFVIREQTTREDTFDELAKRGMPRTASLYVDPGVISRKLTLRSTEREKISLAPAAEAEAAAAATAPAPAAAPTATQL